MKKQRLVNSLIRFAKGPPFESDISITKTQSLFTYNYYNQVVITPKIILYIFDGNQEV